MDSREPEASEIELLTPQSFGITHEELSALNEGKSNEQLHQLGGLGGVARALDCSLVKGLRPGGDAQSLDARREAFGENKFRVAERKSFWSLVFENLQDPTLILLMAAAAVSTVIGAVVKSQREQAAWTEGVAIWVAVMVVSLVGAVNDYQKDVQFKKLNAVKDSVEVKVMRNGEETLIANTEVLVGDVLLLDTGDKVPADGLVFESYGLVADEASLTGESEPQHKGEEDPWCRSGTQIVEGSGKVLVVAVGVDSEWGKTMVLVATETADTPLQESLGQLAAAIGKVGLAVGGLCFVVLMIRWMVENKGFPVSKIASGPLQFFIFAVTIVVVAVPEGLPLAVTISLAYSMKKMMRDNNFVRVLAACETMGGATAICSDKTGTLTENRMTVVAGWFAGQLWGQPPGAADLPGPLAVEIQMNIALNSKAFLMETDGSISFVGNRTECALLMLLRGWGVNFKDLREEFKDSIEQVYGFSSQKKMASVLIRIESGLRLYTKGAAELVLEQCESVVDASGRPVLLSQGLREELMTCITQMASTGLRTLCLAVRDFADDKPPGFFEQPPSDDLTLCCIVGIKDPVRKEVPEAVATCRRAGIFVRMVTGDNVHTAECIARDCGILTDGGLAMEGAIFRSMPEAQLLPLLPRLQVLARSSPTDKFMLVKLLKKSGEVVAVTGDGTNDAPALKESDVGLAMGIAGTEVAKEAADIIIMDDNFSSIVKTVLWGRSVFANLRKFLQFQLTVNGVALVIAFFAAVTTGDTPLNVLELLWVNLIMDAMAALALATEDPEPSLLLDRPHGRNEPLINLAMWKHLAVQATYQLSILFLILYAGPARLAAYSLPSPCVTYSNVDANVRPGIDVSLLNVNGALRYNPLSPAPSADYSSKQARCWPGPCLDLCCNTNSSTGKCIDNLVSGGGHYNPDETPLCSFNGLNARGSLLCDLHRASNDPGNFCQGQADATDCRRLHAFQKLDNQASSQYQADISYAQENIGSLVFNTFIFMQVFNEINCRKIRDEVNVFAGIWRSRTFLYIIGVTLVLQLLIMLTPIRSFFHVRRQSWAQWVFAVAIGAGSMPLAWLTKVASRIAGPRALDNNSTKAVQAL